ncbi:biosynthetic-type acetolactate synthase large subunit [Sphingopyxis yananensis]|uniref:biosynthetic-type acetolactate synthase large subunit n=1 Tax=Sphingopyxis yananensis TaxID=2886687 RepID=UPI001D1239D1|nr:biosynthetic-type acetolactate synthase large subunit [Sphingopyxis yananensis]MCC2603409.1 biosynthetic-type acetolactate synthase large subunit [Sphingopyxis yananensis]
MTEMSGADMVVQALVDLGVDTVFGYPGGAVLPIYDALFNHPSIKHVLVRHEQAATHAAEGYARSTGKPGVVLVTSGPGATNAVTGITDALLDSIPMVVLTGQVPTTLIGTDAFQECDTVGITRHCTKHNYLVMSPENLGAIMHEAFHIATHGRPGPVVIDIPKNVQVATGNYARPNMIEHVSYRPQYDPDPTDIADAIELIANATRPIFYTGGGVINAGPQASAALREFVAMTGAPITSTLMGLGAYPSTDDKWLGMLGMHGTYESNMAMNKSDLIICVGARFDDRVTGRLDAFAPHSKKIHIDIDRSSINKIVPADIAIVGDAGRCLDALIAKWNSDGRKAKDLSEWMRRIDGWRAARCLDFPESKAADAEIMPQRAVRALYDATRGMDPIVTTEVGQHQMWAAQHFGFDEPNRWLTSGGLGTMGYGFPSAVGAQVANPDRLVICIAGEASVQMNIQEMSTVSQYRLPVKLFILNNEWMGMVRQWQELTYESRYSNSYSDSLPDFVKLADAYGWTGLRIDTLDELDAGIAKMIATPGPVIVDCRVAKLANCFPMIPSGAAHTDMILQSSEVSGTMDDEAKALV